MQVNCGVNFTTAVTMGRAGMVVTAGMEAMAATTAITAMEGTAATAVMAATAATAVMVVLAATEEQRYGRKVTAGVETRNGGSDGGKRWWQP